MTDVEQAASNIIDCINAETSMLNENERVMVLLYVTKIASCAVELEIAAILRMRNGWVGDGVPD